jgi:predicted acylesterase/phospholipase RssA
MAGTLLEASLPMDDNKPEGRVPEGYVGDWRAVVREEQELLGKSGGRADRHDPIFVGLSLSGGGIRSATFNLGILQRLERLGLLQYVDYLSTVSGGGYIGSWLSACKRYSLPIERWYGGGENRENPAFQHLRKYSRYLSPTSGLFSIDTLTMIGILFRNMILNQGLLLLTLAMLMAMPLVARESLVWITRLE